MLFSKRITYIIFLGFLIFITNNPSHAKTSNDFGDWTFTTINLPINDKLTFQEVINTRVQSNLTDFSVLFLRSSFGYQVSPHVSLWLGHDWFGYFNTDFSQENRIWEQAIITHKYHQYHFLHRIRQEERIFPSDSSIATLRYLARVDRPMPFVKNDKYSLIAWDEAFVNYNSNDSIAAGFAENRVFAGAGYKFNKHCALEAGYMLQYLNKADDVLNHWLFTNLVINL